jgi:hypothetical protein
MNRKQARLGEAVVNRVLMGIVVIVLALALVACGGDEESVTVTTDDGQATISSGEGKLAEGFPEEFPIYDADVDGSAVIDVNGQAQYTAVLITSDSVDDVYKWYKSELPSEGWTIVNDAQVNTGDAATSMLAAERNGATANMGVTQTDRGTEIAITLTVSE